MSVKKHPEFAQHEEVVFFNEPAVDLKAIVAIHNTRRGPALGGIRMYPYENENAALTDVLRLSKGMTYKSAISRLPLGGGKAVVIGDPQQHKTQALFETLGRCLETLQGRYIAAEDSGTTVEDLQMIAAQTSYVSGIGERMTAQGEAVNGDPSPATAYGVFMGIKAAVKLRFTTDELNGLKVAVQGTGAVGHRLVKHLIDAGAQVVVADVHPDRVTALADRYSLEIMKPQAIYAADVDVFSPCALGGILNQYTIPMLRAGIVAGAANNQLLTGADGRQLFERGITYAPDFAINAGGVIDIAAFRTGCSYEQSMRQVADIYATISEILQVAAEEKIQPEVIANRMAEENFAFD